MALSARRRLYSRGLFQGEGSEDGSVVDEQAASIAVSARAQQTRKGRRRQRQAPLASITMCAAGDAGNRCKPKASIQISVELP